MEPSNQVLATFPNGGTLRIDNDSVSATVIKVQKKIITAPNTPREEYIIVYAEGVDQIPSSWQRIIDTQAEVDRVHVEADNEEHLIHNHVTLQFDDNQLRLQGKRYQ